MPRRPSTVASRLRRTLQHVQATAPAAVPVPAAAASDAEDDITQPRMHPRELDGDPGPELTAKDIAFFKENGVRPALASSSRLSARPRTR
jgi:hypothetical protein